MDTSSLASGLSLAAFLLVFAYLSLVENASASGSTRPGTSEHLNRLLVTLRLSRLASVLAVVLSAQALVLSQTSPGVALVTTVGLDLLVSLVILDRIAKLLSGRYPTLTSQLTYPGQATATALLGLLRTSTAAPVEPGVGNGKENNGTASEGLDLTSVIITEEEQAGLDARERLMIRSILRLDESTAREVMVPRVDIVAVEVDTPLPEMISRMLESGHSRLPVFSETIDNIIGVIHSRDLLHYLGTTAEYPHLKDVIRSAFFIPESKRLDDLLREFQETHVHMAMVVDEYGGIEGLVTLEDLLEEIVGEIEDEFSRSLEPRVEPLANGDILVDARVTLDYVADLLSIPIADEHVDTIGGLVYSAMGKMPQVGDEVEYNGLRIEVVSLLGRRIRQLKLSGAQPSETKISSPAVDPS